MQTEEYLIVLEEQKAEEELLVQEELSNSLSLITVIGDDLSDSEREELMKKTYMASLAVKDFVAGELDVDTFLDIQSYCLTESTVDRYLNIVSDNLQQLPFAELLAS